MIDPAKDVSTVLVWNDTELHVQHCIQDRDDEIAGKLSARLHTRPDDPRWFIQTGALSVTQRTGASVTKAASLSTLLVWNDDEVRIEHHATAFAAGAATTLRTTLHGGTEDTRWQTLPGALVVKVNEDRPRPDLQPPDILAAIKARKAREAAEETKS